MANNGTWNMIDNYVYLYHTKQFIVIPTFPDTLQDTMAVRYNSTSPMSRSAPIYSYASSGPRSLQITLNLHRDMMTEINYQVSNAKIALGDDYVDTLIKQIQSAAVPAYGASEKLVDPPMIAVRFGNEVFIKGIVTDAVSVSYDLPLLENGKYAKITVAFNVAEVDPYDAQTIARVGSFRGLDRSLERNIWRKA